MKQHMHHTTIFWANLWSTLWELSPPSFLQHLESVMIKLFTSFFFNSYAIVLILFFFFFFFFLFLRLHCFFFDLVSKIINSRIIIEYRFTIVSTIVLNCSRSCFITFNKGRGSGSLVLHRRKARSASSYKEKNWFAVKRC